MSLVRWGWWRRWRRSSRRCRNVVNTIVGSSGGSGGVGGVVPHHLGRPHLPRRALVGRGAFNGVDIIYIIYIYIYIYIISSSSPMCQKYLLLQCARAHTRVPAHTRICPIPSCVCVCVRARARTSSWSVRMSLRAVPSACARGGGRVGGCLHSRSLSSNNPSHTPLTRLVRVREIVRGVCVRARVRVRA